MSAAPRVRERDPNLMSIESFYQFCLTRPDWERWQLIDGLALMMAPPGFVHQKIGRRLFLLLNAAIEAKRPDLLTLYETGLTIPGRDDFNAVPDILVLPAAAEFPRYVDQFLLVAEVMSPSNRAEMIERKLELYMSHPENLYCLTVDHDAVHVTLWAREDGWSEAHLRSLDDTLKLPAFGLEASLAAIYRDTPLAG